MSQTPDSDSPVLPQGDAAPRGARRAGSLFVLVALVILVTAVAGALPRWRARKALAAETRELAIPMVRVVSPVPGKAAGAPLFPAEVKPHAEAPIFARATGYVRRWTTDIGGRVKAGALLAELETPELDQELARARQERAQAEAALGLARSTAERYEGLVGTSGVSEQENREKQSDLTVKTAALDGTRANVRRLEELRAFALVTAPFAGTITSRRIDVGELVVAGSGRELFRLSDVSTLRVFVRVPQKIAAGVAAGQPAEVLLAELPGKPLSARVVRTAGSISAESRTLLVELELENPEGAVLAGSYAEARLLGSKPAALTLPANTLLFREEGPRVGVVRPDGRVELRAVRLGRDFGKTVEIAAGVSATEEAILNPSDSLADGSVVRIVAEKSGEATK
jgi:RND family efflux transporter MFP subunit